MQQCTSIHTHICTYTHASMHPSTLEVGCEHAQSPSGLSLHTSSVQLQGDVGLDASTIDHTNGHAWLARSLVTWHIKRTTDLTNVKGGGKVVRCLARLANLNKS